VVAVEDELPVCLLYLLSVGKEHELVLRVYGQAPTEDDLISWMRDGVVRGLRVSRHGERETFTFLVNFAHVVGARVAPYSDSRTSSF
jgi:hypothetical protein